jgi:hypothetical protein
MRNSIELSEQFQAVLVFRPYFAGLHDLIQQILRLFDGVRFQVRMRLMKEVQFPGCFSQGVETKSSSCACHIVYDSAKRLKQICRVWLRR